MRVNRRSPAPVALRSVTVGVALSAVLAGCGGSSSSLNAPQEAAVNPVQSTAPRRSSTTPQEAARSYIEGVQDANGAAICSVLDSGLQQAIVKEIVRLRPSEADATCAQALSALAAASTASSERHAKLPKLHLARTGNRVVVTYVGTRLHKHRTLVLVKRGSGWLIDKINGKG